MLEHIDTVLFDLDGTLTVPIIDFDGLRDRLGTPAGVSIALALQEWPEERREWGFGIVREVELDAARNARPSKGAVQLVNWLHEGGYRTGIITRNFREAVDITLEKIGLSFDVVLTRDCAPPKPAPDAVIEALRRLEREPATSLMVGDFQDDIQAGRAAGTMTCLVTNGEPVRYEADFAVPWLSALHALLTGGK